MVLDIGANYRHQRSDRKKREITLFICINDLLVKYINCVSDEMYCKLYWIKTVKSIPTNVTYRSINRTELNTEKHDRSMLISASTNLWVGTFGHSEETQTSVCLASWGDDLRGGLFWGMWFLLFSLCPLSPHCFLSDIYDAESQWARNNFTQRTTLESISGNIR